MQNQNEASVRCGSSETAVSRLSLLLWAGITAAVCWTVADMLLVGFVQTPERYPLLSQTLAPQLGEAADFAVLMQAGSPERLLWGVLPATFSTALYLAAAFDVYQLMRPGRTAKVSFAVLFFGYALSPLGHAGFYFTGMVAKVLLNAVPDDYPPLLALFRHFYRMLEVHWMASVGSIAAGCVMGFGFKSQRTAAGKQVQHIHTGQILTEPIEKFFADTVRRRTQAVCICKNQFPSPALSADDADLI